jgi:guanylate kinase
MDYSVSCTTRPMRPGEEPGKSYTFLSQEEFDRRVNEHAFLEHATVHGHRYGTLKSSVRHALASGRDVIMDIDVQGAQQVRVACGAAPADDLLHGALVDLFILAPSLTSLRRRLENRGQDRGDVIQTRLRNAEGEIAQWRAYQYVLVNDELPRSIEVMEAILIAERHRVFRSPLDPQPAAVHP